MNCLGMVSGTLELSPFSPSSCIHNSTKRVKWKLKPSFILQNPKTITQSLKILIECWLLLNSMLVSSFVDSLIIRFHFSNLLVNENNDDPHISNSILFESASFHVFTISLSCNFKNLNSRVLLSTPWLFWNWGAPPIKFESIFSWLLCRMHRHRACLQHPKFEISMYQKFEKLNLS